MGNNQLYFAPSVEVVILEAADIITASSAGRMSLQEIAEGAGSRLNEFDY